MKGTNEMYQIRNFTDNDDINIISTLGPFSVVEYQRDLSVTPAEAQTAYFSHMMNCRRRQLLCDLSQANITTQAGAMQWMLGDVRATTGIKDVGDLFGKVIRGNVTGESAIKPEYTGSGSSCLLCGCSDESCPLEPPGRSPYSSQCRFRCSPDGFACSRGRYE